MNELKNKRKNIKQSLTKFVTYVNNFNLADDQVNLIQLKLRTTKTEELWDKFDEIQNQIELKDSGETEDRSTFEDTYFETLSRAQNLIEKCEASIKPVIIEAETVPAVSFSRNSKIQLPVLTLPKFNGEYSQWLLFKDSFTSTIHANDSLSDIEKFRYLRSVVHGDALHVISALETTHDNYAIAWNLLNNRYENEKLIIHTHMKALFEMPTLTKETHVNLRQTIDNFQMHVRALEALNEQVTYWDTILIYLLAGKLDTKTRRDWEMEIGNKIKPKLDELIHFLSNRCQILEMSEKVSNVEITKSSSYKRNVSLAATVATICPMCHKPKHTLYRCYKFLALSIQSRIDEVKRLKLCFNCLRSGHQLSDCRGRHCQICDKKHNSLLHCVAQPPTTRANPAVGTEHATKEDGTTLTCNVSTTHTLLPTAMLNVIHNNKLHKVRALLDTGSQSNFLTTEICNKLKLQTVKSNLSISGLNQTISKPTLKSNITIASINNTYNKIISCLIVDNITNNLPTPSIDISNLQIPEHLQLADPSFHTSNRIDMLLGATTFFEILCGQQISLGKNKPILQNTLLGWIVAGAHPPVPRKHIAALLCVEQEVLHKQLEQFWKIEEPPTVKLFSKEEEECLTHFNSTTSRDQEGQFIVNMPLRANTTDLGDTKDIAIRRLLSIEKKFSLHPELKSTYLNFMREYESLGHMTRVEDFHEKAYYLPHHPVLKPDSSTTKLRVVFDGSAQPQQGASLNQIQKVGPTIQNDLFSIITRFRTHAIVLTADVEKMYRQVWIDKSQRHLQQIVWREDQTQTISHFQLNTVTYGQTASPFLAIRCLMQLAIENKSCYSTTSNVIENDFYVDDLLSGGANEDEVFQLYTELTDILAQAKMKLRKWNSNSSTVLQKISKTTKAQANIVYVCEDVAMKTLGIHWNPQEDVFQYTVDIDNNHQTVTKRIALSIISQIYDPLGLISPIVIIAKSFMQKLWQQHLNWDEPLDNNLNAEWCNFIFSVQQVNKIKIPRFVLSKQSTQTELHGFCDASEKAYAACIYAKSVDEQGNINVHLVCAKSKVAPLKSLSIPRLELCGALILTKLIMKVKEALRLSVHRTVYWTDSTVVLSWINTSPHLLKSFVANRISEIQSGTDSNHWHHVPTRDNPADIASRGTYADTLCKAKLWWQGPHWLTEDESNWPASTYTSSKIPELKETGICCISEDTFDLFDKFSDMNKFVRVISYVLRFKRNCSTSKKDREIGPLSVMELHTATRQLIKLAQRQSFPEDINQLSKDKIIHNHSKLVSLNPYMDINGILRVGGRLENSSFNINKKHPMILSAKHQLTKLIFKQQHLRLLHAGPQLLLSHIRETYWPVGGRNLAKEIVRKCIKCFHVDPKPMQTLMGNLPANRFESSYPFYITGVDYAGPLMLKDRKGRKPNIVKCYISLFICMVTKAIHLELVSELSTAAFMMALRRFVSRRGKPLHIYSDNGTNFIGANNKLRECSQFLRTYKSDIIEACAHESINWHFIPAHSPHFGGLWEAGVKSIKYHLRRVVGNASLTFEEFNTVITQIESILNSRPISTLTNDVNDPIPLTPAHFLVGRPLTSIPDPNLQPISENRLSSYQRIQQMTQHFWSRWSKEYVSELQQRHKWKKTQQNLQLGTVVLIKDDHLPPSSWILGKVEELHPGTDGLVRVASVKTPNGIVVRRAITKICPLPSDVISVV